MNDLSHLLVHEAYLLVSDDGITLVLRRSKTDTAQRGERIFIPANTTAAGRRYCPVVLTRALLRQGGYERRRTDVDCGPLMRQLHRGPAGHILRPVYGSLRRPIASVPATVLGAALQEMLRAAGRDATQLSGHSLRIGAATAAAGAGASLMEIQQRGRWASSACAQRYVRGPPTTGGGAPQNGIEVALHRNPCSQRAFTSSQLWRAVPNTTCPVLPSL
jgi:hypothetical protein